MGSGIYVALSGAVAQSQALDVTANNVANAGTVGFRAERVRFGEALAGAAGESIYARVAGTETDPTAGTVRATGNPLDLAIDGEGWFAVDTARGPRYTRAGNFRLDAQGTLVTADGHPVRGEGGARIVAPPDGILAIDADGVVRAGEAEVGRLELVRFLPADLAREGQNLFAAARAPAAGGAPVQLLPGAVETANFNAVRGVVDLIRVSRTYEALHRMIESYRQIDERTARDVGSPK